MLWYKASTDKMQRVSFKLLVIRFVLQTLFSENLNGSKFGKTIIKVFSRNLVHRHYCVKGLLQPQN